MSVGLRTEAECLVVVAALVVKAEHRSGLHQGRIETVADTWRHTARQASWRVAPAAAALQA